MKLNELMSELHFDEVLFVKNPYFYIRDYEDKGVIVLLKKDKDVGITFEKLKNVCFECPDMEYHKSLVKMVLFNVDKDNKIVNYSIASSKYKVLRSDILKYEKYIGYKLENEVE